jgi:hypothetical protein
VCHAHSLGVRVVRSAPFNVSQIENFTARTAWVAHSLASVQADGLDGLNLDIEGYTGAKELVTTYFLPALVPISPRSPHPQPAFESMIKVCTCGGGGGSRLGHLDSTDYPSGFGRVQRLVAGTRANLSSARILSRQTDHYRRGSEVCNLQAADGTSDGALHCNESLESTQPAGRAIGSCGYVCSLAARFAHQRLLTVPPPLVHQALKETIRPTRTQFPKWNLVHRRNQPSL